MNSRAWLLVGTLLATSVWAAEPANEARVYSRSFDLADDSIKKIVRDAAATQYSLVLQTNEGPAKPAAATEVESEPVLAELPLRLPALNHAPRKAPAPARNGFMSALFDVLVDELLFDGASMDSVVEPNDSLVCQETDDFKTTTQNYTNCLSRTSR